MNYYKSRKYQIVCFCYLLQSTFSILNNKSDTYLIIPPQNDLHKHKYDPFHGVTGFLTKVIEKIGKERKYDAMTGILSYPICSYTGIRIDRKNISSRERGPFPKTMSGSYFRYKRAPTKRIGSAFFQRSIRGYAQASLH